MSTDMEINKHKHIFLDTIPISGATLRDPSMGTQAYPSHLNLPQRARSIFARTEHSLEEGKLIPLRTTSSSRGWLDKHLAFHRLPEPITCLSEVLQGRMEPPLCRAVMLKMHCYIGFSLPPPSCSLTSVSSGNIFADQLPHLTIHQ